MKSYKGIFFFRIHCTGCQLLVRPDDYNRVYKREIIKEKSAVQHTLHIKEVPEVNINLFFECYLLLILLIKLYSDNLSLKFNVVTDRTNLCLVDLFRKRVADGYKSRVIFSLSFCFLLVQFTEVSDL